MSDGHIFISYRVIEADFALKLAADLKNAGVNVWLDRFELKPGGDWARGIEQGIDTCSAMLVALSPDYVESANCMRELYRAARKGLPLFPVLLRPVDLPYQLEGLQYVDFRDWRDERVYRQKVDELLVALPAAQKGAVPDAETRYLTSLIAELESRKGVLEYVELSAQADAPEEAPARPDPYQFDEWAAGFSMLVEKLSVTSPPNPLSTDGEGEQRQKVALTSITEAVEKFPRFVLIGEPGAGKTTTIRKLARDAARARLENPRMAPLPLFLYLPQWGDEPTPLDFVHAHWPFNTDPTGLLKRGDVVLYLDGLNEMGLKGHEKAAKLRAWLAGHDAPTRIIVTCRAGNYGSELNLGDLPTVIAEALSEAQVRTFASSYLKDNSTPFLNRVLPGEEPLETSRSLVRLAHNPYLLAALIFLYEKSPDGDLPRNNGTLMQALTQALWERERSKNTEGLVSTVEMEQRLANLAFNMIDQGRPTEVGYRWAKKQVLFKPWWKRETDELDPFLRAAQSANLIEIQNGKVRFFHQSIQEYFAALRLTLPAIDEKVVQLPEYVEFEDFNPSEMMRFLIRQMRKDMLSGFYISREIYRILPLWRALQGPEKLRASFRHDSVLQHFLLRVSNWAMGFGWYEVIVNLCGISDDPDSIVKLLIAKKHFLLAARCIQATPTVSSFIRETFILDLKHDVHSKNSTLQMTVMAALFELLGEDCVADFIPVLESTPPSENMEESIEELDWIRPSMSLIVGSFYEVNTVDELLEKIGTPEALEAVAQWRAGREAVL